MQKIAIKQEQSQIDLSPAEHEPSRPMAKIAIIPIGEAGKSIAARLEDPLSARSYSRDAIATLWHDHDAFVFIGAMGICVRTIAPYIKDKHEDPAVVCIDSLGQNVISVLSGHIGGANELTRTLSGILGAHEVITTQSDISGLWALDCLEQRFPSWENLDVEESQQVVQAYVNRKPIAVILGIRDEGTEWLESTAAPHVTFYDEEEWKEENEKNYAGLVIISPFRKAWRSCNIPAIVYTPRVLTLGLGLAHQAPTSTWKEIEDCLDENDVWTFAIGTVATINVKADEPVIKELQNCIPYKDIYNIVFYTAEELAKVDVPNPSDTVARHVGTPSVCEAAAILGANHGRLIIPKVKGKNWTAALAMGLPPAPPQGRGVLKDTVLPSLGEGLGVGFIEIVGAGPGDPDLISVRGRRMLEQADLILYAGSLVPKALTECHKPGAVVRSSADMNLEEQCQLMKEHYDRGHFIVRLHTGDPCIFGAIQEQMAFFDREGMAYHITPGISSFLAAAAELRSQFTIPERTQTIILTRGEGRTPMPEREQLHLLARSQSTMCIFLSASIVDDVQRELLMEYPEDTPVAACYHLTWPDQKIYRGQLKDLAHIVHDNHLTLTTMLVVGEAIDNRQGLSELYSKHFTHLFRQGDDAS